MLFLDRIEILGFKSFCDKTILKIPSGITAVIGPNGCGKSNVVDAMNWVLGEQSAKSLRSDKMEEVIFNGSRNRKPVNLAQVTLIWKADRENPMSPEVTVARRLFRSGESQYEMNGEICRLKDVHAFFVNEGFDPLAYSILEQGRIEALFLAKPLERRALIEEVAGVAEFKHKKRSAQLKLADNQIQLERIQDILTEVEKQLSSLKRQAAKTRRYQLLKEEKNTIQKIFYHRRFEQISADQIRLQQVLETQIEKEQAAHQTQQQLELVYSEMKLRFTELESLLYQDRNELHQMEMQIQENQNLLQSKRQRIEELRRGIEEKQNENSRLSAQEVQFGNDYEQKAAEEAQLKTELEELILHHGQLFSELEQKGTEVFTLEQNAQQLRKEILELLSNASLLKNEQTRLHTQHDHLESTMQQKQMERDATESTRDQIVTVLAEKRTILEQTNQEIGYLDQTKTDILQRCDLLKVEWDSLQPQVQASFKQKSELTHLMQKLDAQQHSSQFYNESARNLLNVPSRSALGMMMDFIQTQPQFETAVENFLADKLNYLIVQSEDSALDSIDYLKQQGMGYCGFVIKNGHDLTPPVLPDDLRSESGVIGTLRDVVMIQDEALPAVAPFIQSAVVVDNLDCAKSLIKKYPDYQYVTVQGDVILSPALYAGGAKADDVPGLIAIQREKRESSVELESVEEVLQTLEDQVRSVQDRLDISNRELVRLNEVRESKNKDRLLLQMEIDQVDKEYSREGKLLEILSQEMLRLQNEVEAVLARSENYTQQLQQATEIREQQEQTFQQVEKDLASRKEEQVQLQHRVQDSRIQIAEFKERDRALLLEMERLRNEREFIQRSIGENNQLILQRENEIAFTVEVCGQTESLLLDLARNLDQQKLMIQERQQQKESLTEAMTQQESRLQESRGALDQIREERMQTEVEKVRVDTQKEDLLARCQEEMGVALNSLPLPESEFTSLTEEELKNKLLETEARIEKLGSINMLALEEYTEMEERHRFLKTQYDDLKVSIETLLETIQKIDATSLQRFREAFDGVQTHFQDLFLRLFNGGKAEMVLIDPENPNESGIEIHVQPPGKRLQNMNLLSGGEKSLTGVAFLMALFQYHTSPFCIMDEVDAALDEVNVQRFTSLISDMKKQIQFIVVTHNKRTMEAADQLYGVTMSEPGVSSILSARFEEAEALIEN
jgi:chromosome segregation protein